MPPAPFHTGKEEKLFSQVLTPVSHGGQLPGFVRTSPLRPPGPSRPGLMDKGVCPEHQEARGLRRQGWRPRGRTLLLHAWNGGRPEWGAGAPFPKRATVSLTGHGGPCGLQILVMGREGKHSAEIQAQGPSAAQTHSVALGRLQSISMPRYPYLRGHVRHVGNGGRCTRCVAGRREGLACSR